MAEGRVGMDVSAGELAYRRTWSYTKVGVTVGRSRLNLVCLGLGYGAIAALADSFYISDVLYNMLR